MYFRGMSDWNLAELEDIDRDVFGRSGDHIVPYQGVEFLAESSVSGNVQKKPRHEGKNGGRNVYNTGSSTRAVLLGEEDAYSQNRNSSILEGSQAHTSNVVVPTLRELEGSSNTIALPTQDGSILDSCINESNSIAKSKMSLSNYPHLGTTVLTKNNSCLSSLHGVPPDFTDLLFQENDQKPRNNDLAYYDWPDISNFEDIDKMFRNWDSTFGQGQPDSTDELSWFSSSSNAFYGSEIAYDQGFQSSSSDLCALQAELESHSRSANFLEKNVSAIADHSKPTSSNYANWLGTHALSKAKSAGKEKSLDGRDGMNNVGIAQFSNDYSLNSTEASDVQIQSHQSSEDKRTKRSTDQVLLCSDASDPQIFSAEQFSQEHFVGSFSSSYKTDLDPHFRMESGLPAHQFPFSQTANFGTQEGTNPSSSYRVSDHTVDRIRCADGLPDQLYMHQATVQVADLDKVYQRQQLCGGITTECPHQSIYQSNALGQKKLAEARDDAEMEDTCLVAKRDHPTAHESSSMTSTSTDNISEEVTSFRQLQDVMHQLDVRTKLCIRDSLYRLARSAQQRHGFTIQNCSEGARDAKGIQIAEASQRSAEFMNAETSTNPIDRSIAHLLFHKPSEPATRSANDTKSLESHIMNGQIIGPISNHAVVPDQRDCQRIFGACSDMETDLP